MTAAHQIGHPCTHFFGLFFQENISVKDLFSVSFTKLLAKVNNIREYSLFIKIFIFVQVRKGAACVFSILQHTTKMTGPNYSTVQSTILGRKSEYALPVKFTADEGGS
jgi:hypothetical protein